jgi:hypothetical protein
MIIFWKAWKARESAEKPHGEHKAFKAGFGIRHAHITDAQPFTGEKNA